MNRLLTVFVVVGVILAGGCSGSSQDKKDDKKADGGKRSYLTDENFGTISKQVGIMDKNQVTAILGGFGKPTNDELPGLIGGDKLVWEEEGRKVYVSFDPLSKKVSGVATKGF